MERTYEEFLTLGRERIELELGRPLTEEEKAHTERAVALGSVIGLPTSDFSLSAFVQTFAGEFAAR